MQCKSLDQEGTPNTDTGQFWAGTALAGMSTLLLFYAYWSLIDDIHTLLSTR